MATRLQCEGHRRQALFIEWPYFQPELCASAWYLLPWIWGRRKLTSPWTGPLESLYLPQSWWTVNSKAKWTSLPWSYLSGSLLQEWERSWTAKDRSEAPANSTSLSLDSLLGSHSTVSRDSSFFQMPQISVYCTGTRRGYSNTEIHRAGTRVKAIPVAVPSEPSLGISWATFGPVVAHSHWQVHCSCTTESWDGHCRQNSASQLLPIWLAYRRGDEREVMDEEPFRYLV